MHSTITTEELINLATFLLCVFGDLKIVWITLKKT